MFLIFMPLSVFVVLVFCGFGLLVIKRVRQQMEQRTFYVDADGELRRIKKPTGEGRFFYEKLSEDEN